MFNQILVHPGDQVFHRFLWREKATDEPTVYQWLRLSFGDKPAPNIASNSIKVLAKAAEQQQPQAAAELLQHVFVDDVAGSKPTVEKVKDVTSAIDSILGNGKFEIKTWHSNSKEIDESEGEMITDLLSHKWNKETDKCTFKGEAIPELTETLTKRNWLALVAKLWNLLVLPHPWRYGSGTTCKNSSVQVLAGKRYFNTSPKKMDREFSNNELSPIVRIRSEIKTNQCEFSTRSPWILRCRWSSVRSCIVPPLETYGRKSSVCSSYYQSFRSSKKSIPKLELLGSLTLARIYDACLTMLKFADTDQAGQKILLDRLHDSFILDKDSTYRIPPFCLCPGWWNPRICRFARLPICSIKW